MLKAWDKKLLVSVAACGLLAGCGTTTQSLEGLRNAATNVGGQVIRQRMCEAMGTCAPQAANSNQMSVAEIAIETATLQNMLSSSAQRTPNPSPSQAQLYDYSDNYAIQGGIMGALVAGVVGCLISDYVLDGSCSEGAIYGVLIGGAVGAVAGSRIGERQNIYRDQEITLNEKLGAARSDLEDARRTRAAAQQVAQSHETTLASLNAQFQRNEISRDRLVQEIGYAADDLEAMTAARNGLAQQIELFEEAVAESQPDPAAQADAQRIIADLRQEETLLDNALRSLSGTVQQARV